VLAEPASPISRALYGALTPMILLIPRPDAIRVEYRNGKRYRRSKFRAEVLAIPLSDSLFREYMPARIRANDSASGNVFYGASIPYLARNSVFIYYGATVFDWKGRLRKVTIETLERLVFLEKDHSEIRRAVIGVARLAITKWPLSSGRIAWAAKCNHSTDPDNPLPWEMEDSEMGNELRSLFNQFEFTGGHIYLDTETPIDTGTAWHAESFMAEVQKVLDAELDMSF
jgi:hypothetical protein